MPYFTVAQGLQGLEGGLRTGMPEFSAGEAQRVWLKSINWFSRFDGDSNWLYVLIKSINSIKLLEHFMVS